MKKLLILIAAAAMIIPSARADDHRKAKPAARSESNYILRRQQAYQVQGVPTSRLIIGKRDIDIYPNGLIFEGDHVVGETR
jgi:hypothetical protein